MEGVEGADGAVVGGGAEEWFGKDGGVGGYADDGGGVGVAVGCEGWGVGGLGTDMWNGDEEGNEGREVGEMHCVVVKKTCRGVERTKIGCAVGEIPTCFSQGPFTPSSHAG